ncbi:restriction endonuclease subunit S [Streptomyces sp. NPDC090052]|uniref:restriction endonuclease subunit S n=1 Tax=Streptomyces sp. NPDC090052 TaxID=3365931 RepID=UPI00380EDA67
MTLAGAVAMTGNDSGWTTTPLRAILRQVNRTTVSELPLLGVSLHFGVTQRQADDGRTAASEDLSNYKVVRPGDVIMNRLGKPHGSVGMSPWRGITSPAYWVIEVGSRLALPEYVHYLLRSHHLVAEYSRLGKNQPPNQFDISWDSFRSIEVPLPPLEDQRRIADFLDTETTRIDALVASQQRLMSCLSERRTAGVVAAVSGGDHPERRSVTLPWLETLPASWQEIRLGLLARMGSGHTPSRSHPEWWLDCTIPWITTGEVRQVRDDRIEDLHVTREKISELGLANSSAELCPKGTVFLSRTASAGYSGVMGCDMATSQDFVTWSCGPRLDPYFLLWCLRAMRPDLLGRLAMGSTHKTIYVPDLQMLRIPLPPLSEQVEAVKTIRRQNSWIDILTDKVRRQEELLRERRQALITAAVTGQFDVSTASGRNVTDGVQA